MNEIVKETSLSKGTVNNIIQDWKARINGTDIEEIRGFISEVKKSGMTLQECAQAFRIANTLKKLSIYDEFDERMVDDYEETRAQTVTGKKNIMEEVEVEVEEKQEKENDHPGFKKRNILELIRSTSSIPQTSSTTHYTSTKSSEGNKISGAKGYHQINYFINTIYKNCLHHGIKPNILIDWILDLFKFYSVLSEPSMKHGNNYNSYQSNITNEKKISPKEELLDDEISNERPLVSRVSFFIKQRNKEIHQIVNERNTIIEEINGLSEQKKIVQANLSNTIEQEKRAFSYIQWYNNLKQELRDKFNLAIELEFGSFARAIHDFKNHDYNVPQIIVEYKDVVSIREQRETLKDELDSINRTKQHLLNDVDELRDKSYSYRQTMKTFSELQKLGFDLPKLKQLRGLILEISSVSNIDTHHAITKFFNDLQNDYDAKLGFELKIKEMYKEIDLLKKHIVDNKYHFYLQNSTASGLVVLYEKGLTQDDIINIKNLVLSFENSYFVDYKSIKKDNTIFTDNLDVITRNEFWKIVIAKLKDLNNINTEIERAKTYLEELESKIDSHTKKE
jgi:cell division protein FtsB